MRRSRWLPRTLPVALMGVAQALGSRVLPAQGATDSASVNAFYQAWFGAAAQGPERYASFYAEDGAVMPPGLPTARGRAAIAEWLRRSQAAATHVTRPEGLRVDELRFLSPSLVLHVTTLHGQRVPRAGGAATPFETRYVDLLRRTADGGWEVLYRMWSDSREERPPPPP